MAIQRRTVIKHFKQHDEDLIAYFDPCLPLLEDEYGYDYDVVISYMFSRLENAHREILYYGVMKLHDVDGTLAATAIDKFDLTRKNFPETFEAIYKNKIPTKVLAKVKAAEIVRDRILHGKRPQAWARGQAILDTLEYFNGLIDLVYDKSGVWIVGDRRGFKGSKTPLSKETSRWVLMGMGLL